METSLNIQSKHARLEYARNHFFLSSEKIDYYMKKSEIRVASSNISRFANIHIGDKTLRFILYVKDYTIKQMFYAPPYIAFIDSISAI